MSYPKWQPKGNLVVKVQLTFLKSFKWISVVNFKSLCVFAFIQAGHCVVSCTLAIPYLIPGSLKHWFSFRSGFERLVQDGVDPSAKVGYQQHFVCLLRNAGLPYMHLTADKTPKAFAAIYSFILNFSLSSIHHKQ